MKIFKFHVLPWRNWLARSTVNRKVGGSSPPGSELYYHKIQFRNCHQSGPIYGADHVGFLGNAYVDLAFVVPCSKHRSRVGLNHQPFD